MPDSVEIVFWVTRTLDDKWVWKEYDCGCVYCVSVEECRTGLVRSYVNNIPNPAKWRLCLLRFCFTTPWHQHLWRHRPRQRKRIATGEPAPRNRSRSDRNVPVLLLSSGDPSIDFVSSPLEKEEWDTFYFFWKSLCGRGGGGGSFQGERSNRCRNSIRIHTWLVTVPLS